MLCLHFPRGGLSHNLSFVTQPLAIVTSGFPSNMPPQRFGSMVKPRNRFNKSSISKYIYIIICQNSVRSSCPLVSWNNSSYNVPPWCFRIVNSHFSSLSYRAQFLSSSIIFQLCFQCHLSLPVCCPPYVIPWNETIVPDCWEVRPQPPLHQHLRWTNLQLWRRCSVVYMDHALKMNTRLCLFNHRLSNCHHPFRMAIRRRVMWIRPLLFHIELFACFDELAADELWAIISAEALGESHPKERHPEGIYHFSCRRPFHLVYPHEVRIPVCMDHIHSAIMFCQVDTIHLHWVIRQCLHQWFLGLKISVDLTFVASLHQLIQVPRHSFPVIKWPRQLCCLIFSHVCRM